MAKRGPKTEVGKAAVRYNAVRHGVLSPTPVVPGLERQEDWETHCAGLLASLSPEGPLETALAERIILALWRLQRVARYERDIIASSQERVEDDVAASERSSEQVESIARHADQLTRELEMRQRVVTAFSRLPENAMVRSQDAAIILWTACKYFEIDVVDVDVAELPMSFIWHKYRDWTPELVRRGLVGIAWQATGEQAEAANVLSALARDLEIQIVMRRADLHEQEQQSSQRRVQRLRRERLLPDDASLNKVMRYEVHLNRQLYQALHELEAIQARRQGQSAPLARLDVHGSAEP